MLSAMLLGLLAVGAAAGDPAPPVRIWLDHEDGSYMRGERIKIFLKTRDDRYVVVLHIDPDNRLRVLFPLDPGDDNYVKGGKTYKVMNRGGREGIVADIAGRGMLFAAVSPDPFQFKQFMKDDFWDYRTLNATPIEGDLELGLVELTQRMTSGKFDYDLLRYGAYADASEIAPGTDLAYEVEPALSGCLDCAPVSTVVVGAGGPVYCTSPLYDPMCYDPLHWSPGYVPPAYWNAGWGYYGGYYAGGYSSAYYGVSWNAPVWGGGYYPYAPMSPYQPKPWDRQWSGESPTYRPRATMQNVNTVVGPLPSTGRILRADPRRAWDGAVPVAVPAPAVVPVSSGQPKPTAPGTRRQEHDPATITPAPRDRRDATPAQPAQADPRTRRNWSEGQANDAGKSQPSPSPKADNAAGGGSKPSAPAQSASGGGGRRKG
jgi:hypothetical protein